MIGAIFRAVTGFFSLPVAGQVIRSLDNAVLSKQEAAQMDTDYTTQAQRAQSSPAGDHNSGWDILIDVISRLPRPYITFWLVGGFSGWWSLPDPSGVHPFWLNVFYLVITFWFGGRTLFRDLPKAVSLMMRAWKG